MNSAIAVLKRNSGHCRKKFRTPNILRCCRKKFRTPNILRCCRDSGHPTFFVQRNSGHPTFVVNQKKRISKNPNIWKQKGIKERVPTDSCHRATLILANFTLSATKCSKLELIRNQTHNCGDQVFIQHWPISLA